MESTIKNTSTKEKIMGFSPTGYAWMWSWKENIADLQLFIVLYWSPFWKRWDKNSGIGFILLQNGSIFLSTHQLAHSHQAASYFGLQLHLLNLMIRLEASCETPSSCDLALRPSMFTNFKVLFSKRGSKSPFEFFKRSLLQVNKICCCMDILFASGYQSCDGHAGVTRIIIGTLSLKTLFKTFGIMQNGGKAKRPLWNQFCWKASAAWVSGSGLHEK